MADPLVSVVVPVYNGKATIAACVDSLLALDFPSEQREIVVVDNGSTDGTAEVLTHFGSRLRVVREPEPGPAAARNAGVRAARGQLIAFTDADCHADRSWLGHLLPPLRDPAVGITGGRVRALPPGNRVTAFDELIHDQERAIEQFDPPYAITANWGSRREVLERVGLFDESLLRGSDSDLAIRIGAHGYRLVYCQEAVIFHRHESTLLGLFREGHDHGRGTMMLRARGRRTAPLGSPRFGLFRRMVGSGSSMVRGPKRFEALCQMVFDFGNLTGRLAELVAPARSRRPRGAATRAR